MFDIIINPFTTLLLILYELLDENIVLTIAGFTVIVRMAILPLTLRQQRSMKKMQEIQPKLKALQEEYKDDREVLVQKQMELYRENNVNPLAGCLPIFIQLPIFIGLWRAIVAALASTPSDLLGLEHRILISGLDGLVPLNNQWLWLNLALPDPYYVLPILVVITSLLQQKLIMPSTPKNKPTTTPGGKKKDAQQEAADQAAQMTRQMTTFMPFFFGFLALSYSSGLSIYFITSNIIGIIQYAAMGRTDFGRLIGRPKADEEEQPAKAAVAGRLVEATAGADTATRRLKEGIVDTRITDKPRRTTSSSSSKKTTTTSSDSRNRRKKKQRRK
ncbi:MAG: YidC/Oxa1 family membrane protein insertase [Chloroflexi bacterium]|nr:YidC/Oxa1 family membrane protein insertase [Chloroflexota bacterium]